MADNTTISISKELKQRIKSLSAARAKKDGVSRPYADGVYLEKLTMEEQERVNAAA